MLKIILTFALLGFVPAAHCLEYPEQAFLDGVEKALHLEDLGRRAGVQPFNYSVREIDGRKVRSLREGFNLQSRPRDERIENRGGGTYRVREYVMSLLYSTGYGICGKVECQTHLGKPEFDSKGSGCAIIENSFLYLCQEH